jgi:hypothetical protein
VRHIELHLLGSHDSFGPRAGEPNEEGGVIETNQARVHTVIAVVGTINLVEVVFSGERH